MLHFRMNIYFGDFTFTVPFFSTFVGKFPSAGHFIWQIKTTGKTQGLIALKINEFK